MAFSWKDCTVVRDRIHEEKGDCYSALAKYENYLTPRIKEGLLLWLSRKITIYGNTRITKEDVSNDIAELLTKCCKVQDIGLVMKRDVECAESIIIKHIKSAIKSRRIKGLYSDKIVEPTAKERLDSMTIVNKEYLDRYMRGVTIR